MALPLTVKIVTPQTVIFEGEGESVTVQTSGESFGVLPGHIRLLAVTEEGFVKIQRAGSSDTIRLQPGCVLVEKNSIKFIVEGAEKVV